MAASQESIVGRFFTYLTQWSHDKAIDFMEKEGREVLRNFWPSSLCDLLCDFALAEKNYLDTNFGPVKNKTLERKEDKNYLGFVYRAFYQDLEKLQLIVPNDSYVSKLIASLLYFISVRLKLLELYDNLYEAGMSNDFIDFNELVVSAEGIICKYSNPSPAEGILTIVEYEIDSMKNWLKCHKYLENWMLGEAVVGLKKGSIAFDSWEKCYRAKETWIHGKVLDPIPLPPLMFWFSKFKHLTHSKFSLYAHDVFSKFDPEEVIDHFNDHNLLIYTKLQLLQKKTECYYVFLVYDASHIPNYTGPLFPSVKIAKNGPFRKYPTMLCFPVLDQKEDEMNLKRLEQYIARLINKRKEESVVFMNEIDSSLFGINDNSILCTRVDLKIFLLLIYLGKAKNEDRDKQHIYEFVSQLRCHKLFTSINR